MHQLTRDDPESVQQSCTDSRSLPLLVFSFSFSYVVLTLYLRLQNTSRCSRDRVGEISSFRFVSGQSYQKNELQLILSLAVFIRMHVVTVVLIAKGNSICRSCTSSLLSFWQEFSSCFIQLSCFGCRAWHIFLTFYSDLKLDWCRHNYKTRILNLVSGVN